MRFIEFSQYCDSLEAMSGRLETIDLVSEMIAPLTAEELSVVVRFVTGRIFPDWSPLKVGIGPNLLYEAVAYVVGKKKASVVEEINRTGDAGKAIEHLIATKEQTSFFRSELETGEVYHEFENIASIEGKGSQREKILSLRKLFGNASPLEARYLARLVLEELRIGVGEGNVRDAIAKAFHVDSGLVEHAYQAINDLGEVAMLAREGEEALQGVAIQLFRPVKMMLAQQGTIADMVQDHGEVAAEFKYDGSRFQFHKQGSVGKIYSRKLEDVTAALPDIMQQLLPVAKKDVILDGEVIAVKNGKPRPFQFVLRRFRRKYEIASYTEEIELVPHVFDILYHDGQTLIDMPFHERRLHLEKAITDFIAPQLRSDKVDALEKFYQQALDAGHEGIMVKDLDSLYTPGVRGKSWVKIKPEVDTLDLAVIGAEWGEGRRAHFFGSFLLACQEKGKILPVGKVATGITDETLATLYDLFKDLIISQSGKEVTFEPAIVFEVGYSEIQQSPNYESGYALRFPRFVRVRDDKRIDEIDTLASIKGRYEKKT